jgi:hypothetical protein
MTDLHMIWLQHLIELLLNYLLIEFLNELLLLDQTVRLEVLLYEQVIDELCD